MNFSVHVDGAGDALSAQLVAAARDQLAALGSPASLSRPAVPLPPVDAQALPDAAAPEINPEA